MATKVKLNSGGGRKGSTEYEIEHAQRILRLQKKFGIRNGKTIVEGQGYEFNGKDIVRKGSNTKDGTSSIK